MDSGEYEESHFITDPKQKIEKIALFFEDEMYNKKFTKTLFPWIRIEELKKDLATTYYKSTMHWKDLRFFYKNMELTNPQKKLFDYTIEPEDSIVIAMSTTK